MLTAAKAPWKKAIQKSSRHTHLTPAQKAFAKTQAKKAGRLYPNLIDNMNAARKTKRG